MTIIYAATEDQHLIATVLPKLAQNNVNTVRLHVVFDKSWDAYPAKSAVFTTSKSARPYPVPLSAGGDCLIPAEVLAEECKLYIVVEGKNTATGVTKASTRLTVKVLGGHPAVIISDPAPGVYSRLLNENAVLLSRMSALEAAGTVDGSEVIGIRTGADGTVYDSAGDAVREQVKEVEAEARSIYAETENLINRHQLETGLLNEHTGALLTGAEYNQYISTGSITVVSGTAYRVRTPRAANFQRVIFYDTDGAVESCSMLDSNATEHTVTVPEGAVRARLSFNVTSTSILNLVSMVPDGGNIDAPMLGRVSYEEINVPHRPNENNQITASAIGGFKRLSRNMFNKHETYDNHFINQHNQVVTDETFKNYFVSHYIRVSGGQSYTLSPVWSAVYYNESYEFIGISGNVSNTTLSITVPEGCAYIRFNALMSNKDSVMMCEGAELLPFEPFLCKFGFIDTKPKKVYTLREAWCRWSVGEKFPIGFLGDSTTDGMGTTHGDGHESQDTAAGGWGKADYTNIVAYPHKLESMLKEATGNNRLRVYNIGYSGARFKTLIPYYDDIFGNAYADVKMVGIVLGINDRLTSDEKTYYKEFRDNLIYTVEYLYGRGIQPFMVTSQAVLEPHCPTNIDESVYPLRDGESIDTIANGIKREVAKEYGLEVIEMTDYGELMMNYSQIPMAEITTDGVHFKDEGHVLEAEFIYSELCGRCVRVKKGDVLSYASQKNKSESPTDYVGSFDTITNGFKVYFDYNRSSTKDMVLQDFVIFVDEKSPVTLTALCLEANTQYVLIDDVKYPVTTTSKALCKLDVGVHRVKAMSGSSTRANWVGFKIN